MLINVIVMIVKMSAATMISVLLTYILWLKLRDRGMTAGLRIAVGVIYGMLAVLSTHFGIDYGNMIINVRDLGPMCAGLFFDPVAGIIAGMIGGIERYIAGTYFGIGYFTRIACSISTCLAGFLAAFLRICIFKGSRPSSAYAFFMGSVIEVFHMYVVLITHQDEMQKAVMVVRFCSVPMILFSGIGLGLTAYLISVRSGNSAKILRKASGRDVPISIRFERWLFGVTLAVLAVNFMLNFSLQTQSAEQNAMRDIEVAEDDIVATYDMLTRVGGKVSKMVTHIEEDGRFVILSESDDILAASDDIDTFDPGELKAASQHKEGEFFKSEISGSKWLCKTSALQGGATLLIFIPEGNVEYGMYRARDIQAYETLLGDILIFTVIYVLVSMLVQGMVVNNLVSVNNSLKKITDGDLEEKVDVYNSLEFASLSDDINSTVDALKGYIDAAEKRIEQELLLAKTIQDSALPKNFDFSNSAFELYALMDPAREVGGDFYDFFFVGYDKLALVIADVAGKGVPASLFMMQSKTAIRGLAETGSKLKDVFEKVNKELCVNNRAEMFVTVWMGVIDLQTGIVQCINAGHEYPVIIHRDGECEIFKDKHKPPLGAVEGVTYEEYEMKLEPGDKLFVYTDGIPEAINTEETQYGTDRMLAALNTFKEGTMHEVLTSVRLDVEEFVGEADQFDDVTMLGLSYFGINGRRNDDIRG